MSALLIRIEDRVCRLTLNRAAQRNALDAALCRGLLEGLAEAERAPAAGAILLDAAGPVFCEGLDFENAPAPGPPDAAALHAQLFSFSLRSTKPVVAAVQGPCLGAGLCLLANAHIVLAAQGAQFGLTDIRHGAFPFATFRPLALAMGERRALELALTGRLFSAPDARGYGLVHEICPAFELDDRAWHTARRLATLPPEPLRQGLEFTRATRELADEAARALAAGMMDEALRSPDFAEGIRALRERRPPRWPSLESD